MDWSMKLLNSMIRVISPNHRIFLFLLAVVMLAPSIGFAKNVRFCVHTYKLENKINVCATSPLSDSQLAIINNQMDESFRLLPAYSKKKGYGKPNFTVPLSVYVVSHQLLNDVSVFGSKFEHEDVLARYYENKGYLFITFSKGLKPDSTDLPHELAHYYNDNLGITREKTDEKLAQGFERYYRRNVR